MALVIEIPNPFEPFKHVKHETSGGGTVLDWLRGRFPGFVRHPHPTLCMVNEEAVPFDQWGRTVIKDRDVVSFTVLPGDPITILYIVVAVLVVSVVALAIKTSQQPPGQNTQDSNGADSVYNLSGQRNQLRLGQPIEVIYGRVRRWPSYAAQPYRKYENNQQWLYQLFDIGHGTFSIEGWYIEDTPIGNFQDVTVEVCPPGTPVTLFPDNVITSDEVANLELKGTNEAGSGSTWVVDSEGDDTVDPPIEPTGHYAFNGGAGPYVVNPSGTQTNKIEVDVALPRGLYVSNNDGSLGNLTATALFEAQLINDAGTPIGDWFTIASFTQTLATVTPQRYTLSADVDLGRYQVRGTRTNAKNTSSRAGDQITWEQVRAFLPSTRDYGAVTLVAVKARATNNLNDNSQSRFNGWLVRELPTWNKALQEWNDPTPTRSIAWAFVDVFRNTEYGAKLADQFIDLDAMADLNTIFTEREEFCDMIIDQRGTTWLAATAVALLGRAVPMLNGSRITMIRDEPKTLPTALFTPENMVQGSFKWEVKPNSMQEDYDGLEVTYIDPTTWKEETVLCCMDDEEGDDPEKVTLVGCTGRNHAYRWGMWRRASTRYRRENVVFRTGLEGHIPFYGDLVSVSHDMPRWGSGGFVVGVSEDNLTLELSEPVVFVSGVYKLMLRKKTGEATEPVTVTAGVDDTHVVLATAIDPNDFSFDPRTEPPMFLFGPSNLVGRYCTIANLGPGDDDTVDVTSIPYTAVPYSFDEMIAPAQGDTHGGVPAKPAVETVTGLLVNKAPGTVNEVIATWNALRGADHYVLQLSYDGTSWETLGDFIEATTFRFTVRAAYIYVRVLGVTTGAGGWAYWTGDAPVDRSNVIVGTNVTPDPVTDVDLTPGFGQIWLEWLDPVNIARKEIKSIDIFVTEGSAAGWDTMPAAPLFSVPAGQQFWSHSGLPDNVRKNYWFQVRSIFDLVSTVVGPVSATTVNGITLDHLIPGGLQPVEIVTTIPSTGNYTGRIVFLTANDPVGADYVTGLGFLANKLYKWEGSGTPTSPVSGKNFWTASAKAVDLSGQIVSGQIADNAILQAKLADNAVSQAKLQDAIISNAKLVDGAVDAVKIATAAITTTKIADGSISTPKIIAGAVTANEIAALAITTAKIAAGAITTTELAAGSVTAAKIGAGEVTTAKLAAGAVTANEIAANTITGAKIFAGTITSTEIAANAITATQLAADSVVAGKIQAGAITATAIGSNQIITTAANIANAVITSAKISDLEASKITAGTISAAVALSAPLISTSGGVFNSSYGTGSSFPSVAFQEANDNTQRNSFPGGGTVVDLITFSGWATGSGYSMSRYGRSDPRFFVSAVVGFSGIPAGNYASVELVYSTDGGSTWSQVNAIEASVHNPSTFVNVSGVFDLSGMSSTGNVHLAIRLKSPSALSQFEFGQLMALCFNF